MIYSAREKEKLEKLYQDFLDANPDLQDIEK